MTIIEPQYVVDTHALIWYLKDDDNLSAKASAIFDAAERGETRLILSAIVGAELFFYNQKWQSFDDFGALYQYLQSEPYFQWVPFEPDDILDFERDAAVPEMHDRMIAGLARRIGAPLITSDAAIAASGLVQIVW